MLLGGARQLARAMELCGERIAIHPSIAGRVGTLLQKLAMGDRVIERDSPGRIASAPSISHGNILPHA